MKIRVGILGSADKVTAGDALRDTAENLGRAVARADAICLTGATTGLVYAAGLAAHQAGGFHVGVSPAENEHEHITKYDLPIEACDALIFTGFGLKGRNVVLVRSCDIVLLLAGSIGSLNEFTIAYDEGKIIGCLLGTGGVADEAARLLQVFKKETVAQVIYDEDPVQLVEKCITAFRDVGKKI